MLYTTNDNNDDNDIMHGLRSFLYRNTIKDTALLVYANTDYIHQIDLSVNRYNSMEVSLIKENRGGLT